MARIIAVNEHGRSRPRAKLTDHEVELIRQLIEERALTLREIAEKFEASQHTIRSISCYRRRAQTVAHSKRVAVLAATGANASLAP